MARRKIALVASDTRVLSIDQEHEFTTETITGAAVDTDGFDVAALFIKCNGLVDGTFTPRLQESESTDSGFADVAPGEIVTGAYVRPSGPLALSPLTSGDLLEGFYTGSKRYLRWIVTASGSPATGAKYFAGVYLSYPR